MRAFLQRFGEREALLALGCIVSGLVFSSLSPYFATPDNLLTVARNSTELLLIGLGMTLLLGIGGIDVSVGSVLGLTAIGIGRLLEAGAPPALAAILAEAARKQKFIFDGMLRDAAKYLLGGAEIPSWDVDLGRLGLRYRREAQGGIG